ncbi:MAG: hypothetical protein IJJ01_05120 [Firmicutes bacterium]|nr:hypothetical protein [Bacillota bacterium]
MKKETLNDESNIDAMSSLLEMLLQIEKNKVDVYKAEISGLPEGRLSILTNNGNNYYRQIGNETTKGISRDKDLVYKLARKRYLQLRVKEQENLMMQIGVLAGVSRKKTAQMIRESFSPTEKLLDRYGRAGLDILRITCTPELYKWAKATYRKNMKNSEQLIYETYSGIKVRSKSEQSIGNALEVRGIPYRYEPEINLDMSWMEGVDWLTNGRYKNVYPDFVIRTVDGKFIIWEHLGRVDLEEYRKHNMEKIAAYRQNGICDDDHLILTFEKDVEQLETIQLIIAKRILPYM